MTSRFTRVVRAPASLAHGGRKPRKRRRGGLRGIGVTGLNLGVTVVVQVLSIPIFLATVGIEQYGEWLLLTALPTYLSLAEAGFSGAAATFTTKALADHDPVKAKRIMFTAWAVVSAITGAVAVTAAVAALIVPLTRFSSLGAESARLVLLFQVGAVLAWIQMGFVEASWRASDRYATGMGYVTGTRLLEFLGLTTALIVSRSLPAAAATVLGCRVLGLGLSLHFARRELGWLIIDSKGFDRRLLRTLTMPSLTYAGFSWGAGLTTQGLTLLIGFLLGNVETVLFVAVRTLANVVQQLSTVISHGLLPDLTQALARGERALAARLVRLMSVLCGWSTIVTTGALGIFGPQLLHLWTGGTLDPSRALLVAMTAIVGLDVVWQVGTVALRAGNRHQVVGTVYLFACVLAMALAWLLLPPLGLIAAPLSLLVIDAILIPLTIPRVRSLVREGA